MLNAMFNGTGGGGANRSPWALPPAPKSQKAIGHGGHGGGGKKKNKGGVGGIGQHAPVANAKLVRRMADAGRVEEAVPRSLMTHFLLKLPLKRRCGWPRSTCRRSTRSLQRVAATTKAMAGGTLLAKS